MTKLPIDVTRSVMSGIPMIGALYWAVTFIAQIFYWLQWNAWCPLPAKFLFIGTKAEYFWQKAGVYSPIDLVPTNSMGWKWLDDPRGWYGIHTAVMWVLEVLSAGAFVLLLGFVLAAIVSSLSSMSADSQRAERQ